LERERQSPGLWDGFLSKPVEIEYVLRLLERSLHVEWQYAEPGATPIATPESQTIPSGDMIPPSQDELDDLDTLLQKGDLFGIRQYAASLEARKTELQPFTRKLTYFAENFQDDAIQHLLTQFSPLTKPDDGERIEVNDDV
jgi:hypothetical protein